MAHLSVVVITKNEELNMPDFLASHRFADEIIVVDAFSRDRTAEICRAAGATVILNDWPGFPKQWNVGMDAATGDWILIQDADNLPTAELVKAIKDIVARNDPAFDCYFIPRRNIAFGKWIKHCGWYPDAALPRLFRRGVARFDERKSVHEKLLFQGSAGRIEADIIHSAYSNVEEYVEKLNRYTTLEARDRAQVRKHAGGAWRILANKEIPWASKPSYMKHVLPFRPAARFLWMYLFRLGFLDGKHGFLVCALSSFYEAVVDAKVWLEDQTDGVFTG